MLARIHHSMRKKDQGFTLIELLVVMIIIGILAAIAIPVFLSQRKKAVDTGVKSDVSNAGKQIATYYVDASQTSTVYAAISSQVLSLGTASGGSQIASVKLSDAGTVGALASAAVIGVSSGTSCTAATGWYLALKNPTGTGTTFYYSAMSGLTTADQSAVACT